MRGFLILFFVIAAFGARGTEHQEFERAENKAKDLYARGQYVDSRIYCEEILKRDPSSVAAKEILSKSKRQALRLATEAFDYGNLQEEIHQLESAKLYWNRAINYLFEKNPLYGRVRAKLDAY